MPRHTPTVRANELPDLAGCGVPASFLLYDYETIAPHMFQDWSALAAGLAKLGDWYEVRRYMVNGKPRIVHLPPATKALPPNWANGLGSCVSNGVRGLAVAKLGDFSKQCLIPLTEQQVYLNWIGIDIDAEDNPPGFVVEEGGTLIANCPLRTYIARRFGHVATVRTSKSGKGVHMMVRCKDSPLLDYTYVKLLARRISETYVIKLAAAGVKCCVHGVPNLWWHSDEGCQVTMTYNDTFAESVPAWVEKFPQVKLTDPVFPTTEQAVWTAGVHSPFRRAVDLLRDTHILPSSPMRRTQVNIGRVKRLLEGNGFGYIATQSKCRIDHETEVNGFIEITPDGELSLISNPDNNRCIFKVMQLD